VLIVYSTIIVVMLFSTYVYSLNHILRDIHIGFGTVLITFESFASIWMYSLFRRLRWDGIFLATQLSGALLALITILGFWHFLFLAEELTNTGFACLVIHTSQRVAAEDRVGLNEPHKVAPLALRRLKLAPLRVDGSTDRA
jgi:hypothetical protein